MTLSDPIKLCGRGCGKPVATTRKHICDVCRAEGDERKKAVYIARVRRKDQRKREAIAATMPDGWEDLLIEALSEVLFEAGVTMHELLGRQRVHQMMDQPWCVPTVKNLAPRLAVHGLLLSTVLARAESKWADARSES